MRGCGGGIWEGAFGIDGVDGEGGGSGGVDECGGLSDV